MLRNTSISDGHKNRSLQRILRKSSLRGRDKFGESDTVKAKESVPVGGG